MPKKIAKYMYIAPAWWVYFQCNTEQWTKKEILQLYSNKSLKMIKISYKKWHMVK